MCNRGGHVVLTSKRHRHSCVAVDPFSSCKKSSQGLVLVNLFVCVSDEINYDILSGTCEKHFHLYVRILVFINLIFQSGNSQFERYICKFLVINFHSSYNNAISRCCWMGLVFQNIALDPTIVSITYFGYSSESRASRICLKLYL